VRRNFITTIIGVFILFASHPQSIPHLQQQNGSIQLIVNNKPFLLLAGELHNSTAGGFESMRAVWKKLKSKNLNTVIATVSWELIEPTEGKFDFALVDGTIIGARKAELKLVLIWFGSWKNGGSVYIPSWLKRNYTKYPRAKDENGKPLEIISTFSEASMQADAHAFAALMRHVKQIDGKEQTVIMIQVENEMGLLDNMSPSPGNARRDFSVEANTAYNGNVPKQLMDYLQQHKNELFPELNKVWSANGYKTSGSWEEVFGKSTVKANREDWKYYSYYTEELFSAWNYASYVGKVASAGKKEYALPMYVNAWLKQPFTYLPGKYPSGGPLPQVIDVYRAAAPSLDFIAPDIYIDQFDWVCKEFTRSGNPLFIPETRGGELAAARAFYAIGQYNASCFAPFGIDNEQHAKNDPLDKAYSILENLSPLILEHHGDGSMRGCLVDTSAPVQQLELGHYKIEARLSGEKMIAGAIIIQTGPEEFIVAGSAMDIFFFPKDNSIRIGVDATDEGLFKKGKWLTKRRLNGDEVHASTWDGTGPRLPANQISIQKISFYSYK
jgi:beta-galactosidase GanA